MKEINEITQKVLRAYDVSLCEHLLLCTIGYSILLPPEELVRTSVGLNERDPRGEFNPTQYMQALQACIRKNWLQVITEKAFEQEMERRSSSEIPEIYDSGFAPGVVDFTETGYLLHRQIIMDIYGIEHIQYSDSSWAIDEICQEVRIYAPTMELCMKRRNEFKGAPSDYIGRQVGHVVESSLEPIHKWKPNRFIMLSHGFCSVLHYQINA